MEKEQLQQLVGKLRTLLAAIAREKHEFECGSDPFEDCDSPNCEEAREAIAEADPLKPQGRVVEAAGKAEGKGKA